MKFTGYLSKRKKLDLKVYDPMRYTRFFEHEVEKPKYIVRTVEVRMNTETNEREITLTIASKTKDWI